MFKLKSFLGYNRGKLYFRYFSVEYNGFVVLFGIVRFRCTIQNNPVHIG